MALRWKRDEKATGLARVYSRPRGFTLRDNGADVMRVAPLGGAMGRDISGWYWYGCDATGEKYPRKTPKEAKEAAVAFYKEWKGVDGVTIKAKRYDAISYRLMEEGEIVGMALQLANDKWALFKLDCQTRIGRDAFGTPGDVANYLFRLRTVQ